MIKIIFIKLSIAITLRIRGGKQSKYEGKKVEHIRR